MSATAIEMKSQLVAEYAGQFKESASLVVVDICSLTSAAGIISSAVDTP